ncbi:sensor histidine kinase [Bacillus rubiinfantis]|uniref:sensor histidine kinase n=1 Tax=Bacillus rubiinfantis TaxID=1499680 RepID=UPI0006934630|nr:HAMP domain-containing sensor histidine kinase [Bacillus rubiinfantis]
MKTEDSIERHDRELIDKYEFINKQLEKRLQEEIAKNRDKDQLLIKHSRFAAMGEMMASIGHQWRQPLNGLLLLVQDLRDALEYGEIDETYIDRFTRESMMQIQHMMQTINDFRKFYKPNSEKIFFSVGDSIEEALSIFLPSLKNHGIDVEFEIRGQQTAFGYPNEFSQAVLNILANARDAFVFREIPRRKIHINIHESSEYIRAEFMDNAGGIEPELLHKLFDPHFTTKPHGSGLGLYMSKMMLEKMNGEITVKNAGDGVSITLSVPTSIPKER